MSNQPVEIENAHIKLEVWPQFGGKVSSLIDKADNYDLLYEFPAELPDAPRYNRNYGDGWFGGWDECFPAVAKGPYPRHPYDGIQVPDHGELWGIPATAVPTKDGITTVWHGLRFGYRLTRKLWLEDAQIIARYTLVNLAPFEFRFVWALHALMAMTEPVEIDVQRGGWFFSHTSEAAPVSKDFDWPMVESGTDLSKPATLPEKKSWKVFTRDPICSAAVIRYPRRGRRASITYISDDVPAYWGLWMNTGGWSNQKHFAIEPTTGKHDDVAASVKDASAGTVGPLGKVEWEVRWGLSEE
jgi:hypothetical protein